MHSFINFMTPDLHSPASALLSVCILEMRSELAKRAKAEALLLGKLSKDLLGFSDSSPSSLSQSFPKKGIFLSPSRSQNWPSLPMKEIPAWEGPSRKSSVKGTLQDRTALNSWHKVSALLLCRSAGDH